MHPIEIPGYRIEKQIGQGGMATVYLAVQQSLDRPVALKVMAPALAADPTFGERFLKEAKTVARLTHPNILAIYDIGAAGHYHYMAVEYLGGDDLKARIRQGLDPQQALSVLRQLAAALAHAHGEGFVHRDIKPENVLFRKDGTVVLTDFGIAKAVGAGTHMTKTGMSIGTPHYMSPEQARGKAVDGRSDLYSLGVILYEMLTGTVPYHAEDTFAVALKHVNDPLPELPDHLAAFQPLIDRLMAKNPAERFADAAALMGAIDQLQSGRRLERPASATRVMPTAGAPPRPAPPASGGGLKWALGGALLALLIAVGVIYHQSRDSAPVMIGAGPGPSPAPRGISEPAPARPPALAVPQPQARTEAQQRETEQADARRRAAEQAEAQRLEQQARIAQLLSAAEQDIAARRLTLPANNNALDKYRRVLSLDAGNARAQEGLSRIVSRYIELSDSAIGNRDFDRARTHLTNARNILPDAPGLQGAEQRLTAARAAATPKQGERFTNSLGMEFVFIPPGSFDMGSPASEEGRYDDERQHRVTLTQGFWMQTTEVTVAQWRAVMGNNPSGFAGCDKCPVESVSWNDTQDFIRKLNAREGKTYRLPTEAQWECAARAGTQSRYSFGNDERQLGAHAWFSGNSARKTHPVGQKRPNAWGLYDMHGNVWEWCQDWFGDYPSGAVSDPTGPASGADRVFRGGGWSNNPCGCRSANRNRFTPTNRLSDVGFRLVLPLAR